jgi:Fe-S-cluster containining protein
MSASFVRLALTDRLPLTCSRGGTCCHGNRIGLNPWELARLAAARDLSPIAFRERFTSEGGTILRFDGPRDHRKLAACSQYLGAPSPGCAVHGARPLACRLYPLGRRRQADRVTYIHLGKTFPCLSGCPTVTGLPSLSVSEYLDGQDIASFEIAHDAYLDVMQHLADAALVLLLDSGLAASGDRQTLRRWRELGTATAEHRARTIGPTWLDRLTTPALDPITAPLDDPRAFIARHLDTLQADAQAELATLTDLAQIRDASVLMMALALHLGRALGAESAPLADHWIATARNHGAKG